MENLNLQNSDENLTGDYSEYSDYPDDFFDPDDVFQDDVFDSDDFLDSEYKCFCNYCIVRKNYELVKDLFIDQSVFTKIVNLNFVYYFSRIRDIKNIKTELNKINYIESLSTEIKSLLYFSDLDVAVKNEEIDIQLTTFFRILHHLVDNKDNNFFEQHFCSDCYNFFDLDEFKNIDIENYNIFKSIIASEFKHYSETPYYDSLNFKLFNEDYKIILKSNKDSELIEVKNQLKPLESKVKPIESKVKLTNYSEIVYSPKLINHVLNINVIGLTHAKKELSIIGYHHYLRMKNLVSFENYNFGKTILIAGTTGSGKSYLIKSFLSFLNIFPSVTIPATSISAEGWSGGNISKSLSSLYTNPCYGGYSIVHIDEIDKVSSQYSQDNSSNASYYSLLQARLLSILDGEKGNDPFLPYDTSKMLFIFSGAFENFFKKNENFSLGFNSKNNERKEKKLNRENLIKEGFKPELVSRIYKIITLEDLSKDNYLSILKNGERNVIKYYKDLLKEDNVFLYVSDCGYEEIANICIESKSGARAIKDTVFNILKNVFYQTYKYKNTNTINVISVTSDTIKNNTVSISINNVFKQKD